jgi:hypothetical protein
MINFALKMKWQRQILHLKNRAALQHIKRIGENIAKILHVHTNVLKPLAPCIINKKELANLMYRIEDSLYDKLNVFYCRSYTHK